MNGRADHHGPIQAHLGGGDPQAGRAGGCQANPVPRSEAPIREPVCDGGRADLQAAAPARPFHDPDDRALCPPRTRAFGECHGHPELRGAKPREGRLASPQIGILPIPCRRLLLDLKNVVILIG